MTRNSLVVFLLKIRVVPCTNRYPHFIESQTAVAMQITEVNVSALNRIDLLLLKLLEFAYAELGERLNFSDLMSSNPEVSQ